jgi:carbonic anhydrase/acetyltransferase-like protein (isoleucine patch superfamily)
MLIRHREREPVVDPSASIAPTAVLAGNVRVGPRARVMYGAVLRSQRLDRGSLTATPTTPLCRSNKQSLHRIGTTDTS